MVVSIFKKVWVNSRAMNISPHDYSATIAPSGDMSIGL
jgi:hypothetical protein